jgi:hypothetical protein
MGSSSFFIDYSIDIVYRGNIIQMKKIIYLFTMGANDVSTILTWAFEKKEDAEKFEEFMNKDRNLLTTWSAVGEIYCFSSFEEALGTVKED